MKLEIYKKYVLIKTTDTIASTLFKGGIFTYYGKDGERFSFRYSGGQISMTEQEMEEYLREATDEEARADYEFQQLKRKEWDLIMKCLNGCKS